MNIKISNKLSKGETTNIDDVYFVSNKVSFRFPKSNNIDKMLDNLNKNKNSSTNAYEARLEKRRKEEIEKIRNFQKTLQTKFLNHTRMMIQFQFMAPAMKKIREQTTVSGLFQCISNDIPGFLLCERAEVFIDTKITRSLYTKAPETEPLHMNDDLSFDLKKMFIQEGGIVENYIVDGMNYERVIIETHGKGKVKFTTSNKNYNVIPCFKNRDEIRKGVKTKSRLLVPLFYKTNDNIMYTILEDAGLIQK